MHRGFFDRNQPQFGIIRNGCVQNEREVGDNLLAARHLFARQE